MIKMLLAVALVAALHVTCAEAEALLIIANPSVEAPTPMSVEQVAAIYLLRVTHWPDGTHIVPVNLSPSSPLRAKFTAEVLHEDTKSLSTYWNQMHFLGKLPPVVQESQQAVLAFVQRVPGSIGYIDASVIPVDVKVLARVP
jgi:ABC-type phosphate transport system substrate-binding protein